MEHIQYIYLVHNYDNIYTLGYFDYVNPKYDIWLTMRVINAKELCNDIIENVKCNKKIIYRPDLSFFTLEGNIKDIISLINFVYQIYESN